MKFFYFTYLILCPFLVHSQPVINNLGPSIGDSFTLNYAAQQFDEGDPGENQTYDFSSFTEEGSFDYSIIEPNSTEVGPTTFPESTSTWFFNFPGIGDFYNYFDFSENIWREYGTYVEGGFGATTIYTNPLDRVTGPLNYQDTGSDTHSGEVISVQNTPISGTTSYEVDGYGTLILPSVTLENCLRVASITEETQDLGIGITAETMYTEYIYFVEGYSIPIVYYSITESFFLGAPEETTYELSVVSDYNGNSLSVQDVSISKLKLFPNPAVDQVTLNLNEQRSTVRFFDPHGKMVHSGVYSQNQEIDISSFPSGVYIVDVEGESGTFYRKKLLIQ